MSAQKKKAAAIALDPAVDAYVKRQKSWQKETAALRGLLHECGLSEAIKWGKPCFMLQDSNVAIIQGFKASCALMFFKGALMKDPAGLLRAPGENSQAGRRLEFTSADAIDAAADVVRAYVAEAVALEVAGAKVEMKAKDALVLPAELRAALAKKPALKKAFFALTPGRQRHYAMHIGAAKQAATRVARVEACTPLILNGLGLNDR